ncbi:MAG: hypothetical protein HYW24_01675 [Candidatus Aenigmarchaeota archaeon]|nr:hypothetical protein [Candidatus Aenigmarchaeota archaeon]
MMTLVLSVLVSFFVTLFITPVMIRFLYKIGVVGIDQHKRNKPIIPTSGGICVAIGILTGLLTFIGLETFTTGFSSNIVDLLAIISSVLIVTLVGLFDDLNIASKKFVTKDIEDIRIGLPQWIKPLLTLPAAIPLMVISAGDPNINLPVIGTFDVGILFPLLLVPIGIIGASNAINMLGGFNGMETGMAIVYMLGLGIFALATQNPIAILFLVVTGSLLAFIKFNWFPAKILPGDSLTYLLGALIASGVIVGNMETFGIIVMIPFFMELILKLRSKFKASSLGKLRKDDTLENIYGKNVYSLTHIVMRLGRFTEKQITMIFILLVSLVVVLGLSLYLF